MDRHVTNAGAQHGFSLIELLVTILLAGIVFGAMVPLFVGASAKSAADNMRTIATQVAQDKIEKLRQLDYDAINAQNLVTDRATFAGGQFADFNYSQGGVNKVIHVQFNLDTQPHGVPAGQEQYKIVQVETWWDGPPNPVYHTILQTNVYKQYAGPQLVDFVVQYGDGSDIGSIIVNNPDGSQSQLEAIDQLPIELSAQLATADVGTLTPADGSFGLVQFSITNAQGTVIASQAVYPNAAAQQSHNNDGAQWGTSFGVSGTAHDWYWWNWSGAVSSGGTVGGGMYDGLYTFQAAGQSAGKFWGNSCARTYRVETGPPPAPTGLTATGANGNVVLTWLTSSATDVAYYTVYKATSATGPWSAIPDPADPSATLEFTTPNYNDSSVTNDTTYYYRVQAVDDLNNWSQPSDVVSVVPTASVSDTTPPTAPGSGGSISAAKTGANVPSITITWTPSIDPGTSPSGVKSYVIQRASASGGPWNPLQADILQPSPVPATMSYTDASAGYSTTWYYRAMAYDFQNNPSPWSSVVSATTDAPRVFALTVRNDNQSSTAYVYVQSQASPYLYYTQGSSTTAGTASTSKPADVSINKKGKTSTWYLPAGLYWVFYKYSGFSYLSKPGDVSAGATTVAVP
jgi:prepilin-type N-terminal cleavage/methylation domain-containing protein